jgi:isopenicillin-N N-acyltransferase like protein
VCRPPRQNLGGVLTATVATIVMVPTDGLMEVAMLPSEQKSFARYTLAMEELIRAAPAPKRAVA